MHSALQVLQPGEGCALSSVHNRERIFPFSGNPSQSQVGWGWLVPKEKPTYSWIPSLVTVLGLASWCVCKQASLESLWWVYMLTGQRDTAHNSSVLGKQTGAQFAPRTHLHCSCVISWRLGSPWAQWSDAAACNCTKPCPSRGRCVVFGRLGCVSWTASRIVSALIDLSSWWS